MYYYSVHQNSGYTEAAHQKEKDHQMMFSKSSNFQSPRLLLSPHSNGIEQSEVSHKKMIDSEQNLEKNTKETVDKTFSQKIEDNLEMITEKILKERQCRTVLYSGHFE